MTARVHDYGQRDGFDVCKRCGAVRNRDAVGPRYCPGIPPPIELRHALASAEEFLEHEKRARIEAEELYLAERRARDEVGRWYQEATDKIRKLEESLEWALIELGPPHHRDDCPGDCEWCAANGLIYRPRK
jgi:hypothetical protein